MVLGQLRRTYKVKIKSHKDVTNELSKKLSQRCSSAVETLPSMHKALDFQSPEQVGKKSALKLGPKQKRKQKKRQDYPHRAPKERTYYQGTTLHASML
jgi:hypothetical protein